MFSSLIYVLVFLLTYTLILIYPKTATKLNLVKQFFITFAIFICIIALPGFLLKTAGIMLSLNNLSIMNGLISLGLFLKIKKESRIQKFYLDKVDLINVIILTVLFIALFIHLFSIDLKLCYLNSDIANHYSFATLLVEGNNEDVGIMYLTALINATVINIFKPFLEPLYYYKAFIIGDAIINWFGLMMFYVVLTHFVRGKKAKWFNGLYSILFFLGYPIYSYMIGGFIYWSLGVTLICFLIYLLDVYATNKTVRKEIAILVVCSFLGIGMSYALFVPCVFVASFFYFVNVFRKEGNIFAKGNYTFLLKVYIVPLLIILLGITLWLRSGHINLDSLKVEGGIYANLYSDFLPLLPFVLYSLFSMSKKEKKNTQIFAITFILAIGIMLLCCHEGVISRYYYYKMYYPLWMLFWIETARAIESLADKKERFFIYYLGLCLGVLIFQNTPIEEKIVDKNPKMQTVDREFSIFPLYTFMTPFIENGFAPHDSNEIMDIYNYVMYELEDNGGLIPCIASKDYQADCYWYSAITQNGSHSFFSLIREQGLSEEVLDKLEKRTDYFVMFKQSELYQENINILQEYEIEYENSLGVIYKSH